MISVVDDTQRCVVMATLVQDDIGWLKRVKKAVERSPRKKFYSTKCLTLGRSKIICEEDGWLS